MAKKIAYLGLDNAGKTSIITAITKRFGFEEEVIKLTPTRRVDRETFQFLGIEFIRMDFGGQKKYREDYLKSPSKFLGGTDLVFYVVDIQDPKRYIESIDYLEQILLYFKEAQNYPPIAVLFHKFDPSIAQDKEINNKALTLKQMLAKYSIAFDMFFFETSVYDIKSVMDSFSSGLSLVFKTEFEIMSNLFEEISKNYKSILITLFDSKGITIGEYHRPNLSLIEKLKMYEIYLRVQKRIVAENRKLFEFSDVFETGERFSGVVEVLKLGNLDFYLLFIIEEDEDMEKTINILDKIEAAKPQMENLILQIIQ